MHRRVFFTTFHDQNEIFDLVTKFRGLTQKCNKKAKSAVVYRLQ
jgi:hypothetical protein